MTADVRFANIRARLRELFLDELLVDEGWAAYINLLLANISYANLLLLRTNGFPAAFNFPQQVFINGQNGRDGYLEECFTVVAGDDDTIGFRYDGTGARLLDFGTIDLIPVNIERVTVTDPRTGATTTWQAGYGPEFITFDSAAVTTFYVARARIVDAAGEFTEAPEFDLLPYHLPESLDPAAIDEAVYAKQAYFQPLEPPTSPQALFGLLARLLRGKNINIWYEFANGTGDARRGFADYVKFHALTATAAAAPTSSYITAWTDSPVPIDALRDMFGTGAALSRILGYDKQYIVALNNAMPENIIPLIGDDGTAQGSGIITVAPRRVAVPQAGATFPLQVATNPATTFDTQPLFVPKEELEDSFVLLATDEAGNLVYLADPFSVPDEPIVGITKFYAMLTVRPGGLLKKIHLEAHATAEDMADKIAALEQALNNAAKPGVSGDLAFYFPDVDSTIDVADTYNPEFYIASSAAELTVGQRGGHAVTNITVKPEMHEFDVKAE